MSEFRDVEGSFSRLIKSSEDVREKVEKEMGPSPRLDEARDYLRQLVRDLANAKRCFDLEIEHQKDSPKGGGGKEIV